MTNAEATITENAATVAEQGAHVAPEKASSKKGATQKKGAPKGQKAAKGKAKASPKKEAKAGKKAAKPAHAKEASTPRREQGRKDPGTDRAAQGSQPRRDPEGHGLAGPQRPGLPLDRRQEARPQDRVHEDRGRRSRISDQEVGISGLPPPLARAAAFHRQWRWGRSAKRQASVKRTGDSGAD